MLCIGGLQLRNVSSPSQLLAIQVNQFIADVSATTWAVTQECMSVTHTSSSTVTSESTPIMALYIVLYSRGLRKLIQQIKAREFTDFAELPPAKGRQTTPAKYNIQILFVQLQDVGQQQKFILDYLTWSRCFTIYMAVLGTENSIMYQT